MKYHLITYGWQMNTADSEEMAQPLIERGITCLIFLFAVISNAFCQDMPRKDPLLFYLQEKGSLCEWHLYEPVAKRNRVVAETPACPGEVIWDTPSKSIITAVGKTILRSRFDNPNSWTVIAEYSSDPQDISLRVTPEGKLRISRLQEIEHLPRKQTADGAAVVFADKQHVLSAFPSGGIPYLAIAEEWTGKGWQIVEVEPTSSGAEGTSGLDVLSETVRASQIRLSALLEGATCRKQECSPMSLKVSTAIRDQLNRLYPLDEYEGYTYLPLREESGLLFGLTMGDTLHGWAPAYFCQRDCESLHPLVLPEKLKQLNVSVSEGYGLITEEYYGNHAIVVGPQSQTPVASFPAARSAVWLPLSWAPPAIMKRNN
jgi:hypothetical protein